MMRTPRVRQWVAGLSLLTATLGCPSGENNGPGPITVDRVTVSPATLDLLVGAQQGLSATALAADGTTIPGKAAAWSSNNTAAASVNATSGLVTAVGAGSAVITAVIDGRTGQATVQVTLPPQPLAVVTAGTGTGTVTASPDGISCTRAAGASSGTCNTTYPADTPVTLQAVAAEGGHTFQGWSGEGCTGTGPCQVVMSQARTVTATFAAPHQLTITTAGGGNGSVASTPAGIACSRAGGTETGTCALPLPEGTTMTLTATAAVGHAFAGWTGGGCTGTAPCQVTMTEARTITATFIQTPTLTVVMAGTGSGMVISAPVGIACGSVNGAPSGACSAPYPAGASVTLTAQGTAGSAFIGWSGEGCSGTAPCQVTMTEARTVTATFMLPVTLTVHTAGDGDGVITSEPAGINCSRSAGSQSGLCSAEMPAGSLVTLTANPAEDHALTGWSGAPCLGTGPCQVQMNGPLTVTGTFARQLVPLRVTLSGDGTGMVTSTPEGLSCGLSDGTQSGTCEWMVAPGTEVTLTAQTSPGFGFSGWTGGGCSGTGACTLTVQGPVDIAAGFLELRATLTVLTTGQGNGTITSTPSGITCTRTNGSQSGTCQISIRLFERVVLEAAPAAGHTFAGWSGGGCTGTETCEVTVSAAITVTASFAPAPELLVVATEGIGNGTVTSAPAGIACTRASEAESGSCAAPVPFGTTVTLTATGSGGHEFTGWTGGGCSGTGTCQVSMTQAREVRAAFTIPLGIGFGPEQWVDIPAGTYVRGSTSGTADNQPPHTVTLTQPFRMLKTEVTWAQYQQVVNGTDPGSIPADARRRAIRFVDMDDIRYWFLAELNRIDPGKGYRLPTEAEWEYAARAGDGADAPANVDTYAWHSLGPDDGPKPVAGKLPNAWGLYDMLGNVAEWVQDFWGSYPSGSVTDPVGGSTPGSHPVRGGSYFVSTGVPNYYQRSPRGEQEEEGWVGFRIVASGGGSYTLTVAVRGTGSGRITSVAGEIDCVLSNGVQSGDCSHTGAAGTSLGLFTTTGSGSTIMGWTGGGCGTGTTCTVLFNQDLAVTATFHDPFTLTIAGAGSGQGRVVSKPAGLDCFLWGNGVTTGTCSMAFPPNSAVELHRQSGSMSLFTGYSPSLGGCVINAPNPCWFRLDADQVVTATFQLGAIVTLRSLYANGNGTVTATGTSLSCRTEGLSNEHRVSGTCGVLVPLGSTLTLTPNPSPGGHWFTWDPESTCGAATSNCTLTVTGPTTIGFAFWNPCVEFVPGGPVAVERSVTISAAGPCFWYRWSGSSNERLPGPVFLVYQTGAARMYLEHSSSAPLRVGLSSSRTDDYAFLPATTRTAGVHEDFLLGPGLHVAYVGLPASSGSTATATVRIGRLADPAANRCVIALSPPVVESTQSLGSGDCGTSTVRRDYYLTPAVFGAPVTVAVEGLGFGLVLEQLDHTHAVIASASASANSVATLTATQTTAWLRFRVTATLPQGVSGPYRFRVEGSTKVYR